MLLLNHQIQAEQFDRDCGTQPAKWGSPAGSKPSASARADAH